MKCIYISGIYVILKVMLTFTEQVQNTAKTIVIKDNMVVNLDHLIDIEEKSSRVYTKSFLSYLPYQTLLWIRLLNEHPMLCKKVTQGVLNMSLENMKRNNIEKWLVYDGHISRELKDEELLCHRYQNNMQYKFDINTLNIQYIPNYFGGMELTKLLFGLDGDPKKLIHINPKYTNKLEDIECIYYLDSSIYVTRRWLRMLETSYIYINDWEIRANSDRYVDIFHTAIIAGLSILIVESKFIYRRYEEKEKYIKHPTTIDSGYKTVMNIFSKYS